MAEFGWTIPILIDEAGSIIAGHGRLLAAALLGFDEAPTIIARGWSNAQKRAYLIADNKLTMNATWDEALLRVELGDLAQLGMADLTGFSETELREFGIGVEALGGMPMLADGERSPFQQMTFILHETQAEAVSQAITRASAISGRRARKPKTRTRTAMRSLRFAAPTWAVALLLEAATPRATCRFGVKFGSDSLIQVPAMATRQRLRA